MTDPRARTRTHRKERVLLLLLSVILVAGLLSLGWNLTQLANRSVQESGPMTPPASMPSPQPGSSGQSGVGASNETVMQQRVLQRSPLYDHAAPRMTDCPRAATVKTREDYEAMVRAQVDCVHEAWRPILAELGFSQTKPAVEFFRGPGSDSACGALDAPAFYCSLAGGTLHFGDGHFAMAKQWKHSVNEMVNHEYGHHLQSVTGMTLAKTQLGNDPEWDRRSELQTICWSAMMATHNDAIRMDAASRAGWQARFESMLADETHGGQESLVRWGRRGLEARSVGECNTWTVPAEEVA
ncbi:MAG: hypothetical protein Q4D96_14545 [Propionibacteriaceae bacterium]|nr:hypothetical protein [Propionibacteriaceae bacterium]